MSHTVLVSISLHTTGADEQVDARNRNRESRDRTNGSERGTERHTSHDAVAKAEGDTLGSRHDMDDRSRPIYATYPQVLPPGSRHRLIERSF